MESFANSMYIYSHIYAKVYITVRLLTLQLVSKVPKQLTKWPHSFE